MVEQVSTSKANRGIKTDAFYANVPILGTLKKSSWYTNLDGQIYNYLMFTQWNSQICII